MDEKNCRDFVIYFTRCDCGKSIRMLSLYYSKLIGNIEEYEGKVKIIWWLMVIYNEYYI